MCGFMYVSMYVCVCVCVCVQVVYMRRASLRAYVCVYPCSDVRARPLLAFYFAEDILSLGDFHCATSSFSKDRHPFVFRLLSHKLSTHLTLSVPSDCCFNLLRALLVFHVFAELENPRKQMQMFSIRHADGRVWMFKCKNQCVFRSLCAA